MSICSHVLYLALTQDLQRYLPNTKEIWSPPNLATIPLVAVQGTKSTAALALVRSIFKKFEDTADSKSCDAKALDMFMTMNNRCQEFDFDLWSLPEELVQVFTWAKTYIDRWMSVGPESLFDPANWLADCDFGPGASVKATGGSFYHKVGCSPLTMTDEVLYSIYLESMRGCPTWFKAEKLRRDTFGRPMLVSGSNLCFVPKNTEISRTICTEPSLNMFVQKGLGSLLERTLSRSLGFDLRVQQFRNKRLAQIGSRNGALSTIDLSSASDTISLAIVRYLFPPHVVSWLEAVRSPCTTLPDGRVIELHMISSMGNGFTFPLQTMIFSAIALGVYKVCGAEFSAPTSTFDGNLGVFGDDIVILTSCFDVMCRALNAAGFIVNQSKSFSSGLFRESCGGDYFDGRNVRGVYCKTLQTTHARYSLINRLNVWSANHGIPLTRCIETLLRSVRFIPVPAWESDIAGIKVPLELANVKRNRNGSFVYRRLRTRTMGFDVSDVENSGIQKQFRVIHNPDAILLSAVKGTLRGGSLSIRLDVVRPFYKFGIAPCWDYIDMAHSRLEGVGFGVWKQMTSMNVGSHSYQNHSG